MDPVAITFETAIQSPNAIDVDHIRDEIHNLVQKINSVKDEKFKYYMLLNELILKKNEFISKKMVLQQEDVQKLEGNRKSSVVNHVITKMKELVLKSIPLKEQAEARKKEAKNFRSHQIQKTIQDQFDEMQKISSEFDGWMTNYLQGCIANTIKNLTTECGNSDCNDTKASRTLKKCAGCQKVFYCSIECQKKDWPTHKLSCNKVEQK